MALRISTEERTGQGVVVTATGEVDLKTVGALEDRLAVECGEPVGSSTVVMDLSSVDFFGSAGIAAVVWAHRRCARSGLGFAVVASRAVRRPLELVGLGQTLPIETSVNDAFAAAAVTR
jgi:anti-sigma B factor antagonist